MERDALHRISSKSNSPKRICTGMNGLLLVEQPGFLSKYTETRTACHWVLCNIEENLIEVYELHAWSKAFINSVTRDKYFVEQPTCDTPAPQRFPHNDLPLFEIHRGIFRTYPAQRILTWKLWSLVTLDFRSSTCRRTKTSAKKQWHCGDRETAQKHTSPSSLSVVHNDLNFGDVRTAHGAAVVKL